MELPSRNTPQIHPGRRNRTLPIRIDRDRINAEIEKRFLTRNFSWVFREDGAVARAALKLPE